MSLLIKNLFFVSLFGYEEKKNKLQQNEVLKGSIKPISNEYIHAMQ